MSNTTLEKLYESMYLEEQDTQPEPPKYLQRLASQTSSNLTKQEGDPKVQQAISDFINTIVQTYNQKTPEEQEQIEQTLQSIIDANGNVQKIQQIITQSSKNNQTVTEANKLMAGVRGAGAGLKQIGKNISNIGKKGGQSVGSAYRNTFDKSMKGDLKQYIDNFKNNIGRELAESQRDMKDMKFDPAKYSDIQKDIDKVQKTLKTDGGINAVDTKWDRFTHGVGNVVGNIGGFAATAAAFTGLNAVLGSTGLNPYAVKAISGAASSLLRDIKNDKLDKGSVKRALIGAGIGLAVQGASDVWKHAHAATPNTDHTLPQSKTDITSSHAEQPMSPPNAPTNTTSHSSLAASEDDILKKYPMHANSPEYNATKIPMDQTVSGDTATSVSSDIADNQLNNNLGSLKHLAQSMDTYNIKEPFRDILFKMTLNAGKSNNSKLMDYYMSLTDRLENVNPKSPEFKEITKIIQNIATKNNIK